MTVPARPKLYHIAHVDRLASIVADQRLWCDREVVRRAPAGTPIGMNTIKQRRLNELRLTSHPTLFVGDCVPFYFCPRSVMLYLTSGQSPGARLPGRAGTDRPLRGRPAHRGRVGRCAASPLGVHVVERGRAVLRGPQRPRPVGRDRLERRTGPRLAAKDGKQAEFLLELSFPWHLVERIGVQSRATYTAAVNALPAHGHRPPVEIRPEWYY